MTEPPTLVLRDADEERTLVDPARLSSPEPAFFGPGDSAPQSSQEKRAEPSTATAKQTTRTLRLLLTSYRREMMEVSVALAFLVCLGSLVHQQWQLTDALRAMLAQIPSPRQELVPLRSDEPPRLRETFTRGEVERRELVKHLAAEEREALERKAAALIASNDFQAALDEYQTLAELFPDDQTLRDVVAVLRVKLRCDSSSGFEGRACR